MSDDAPQPSQLVVRLLAFAQGCRGSMWQSRNETIALMDEAAAQITKLQADGDKLAGALEACRAELFAPEPNCSCHISPPCGDCVDYASVREADELATQALTEWKDRA